VVVLGPHIHMTKDKANRLIKEKKKSFYFIYIYFDTRPAKKLGCGCVCTCCDSCICTSVSVRRINFDGRTKKKLLVSSLLDHTHFVQLYCCTVNYTVYPASKLIYRQIICFLIGCRSTLQKMTIDLLEDG
jgi:hypothetical protein